MKNWKSRLFGDTSLNFYGWLAAGLLGTVASLWLVIWALRKGASETPECLLLLAIYIVLVGSLGLNLQGYLARVARELDGERADDERVVDHVPRPTSGGQTRGGSGSMGTAARG